MVVEMMSSRIMVRMFNDGLLLLIVWGLNWFMKEKMLFLVSEIRFLGLRLLSIGRRK